jgi:long-chain fatty acid transport protein
MKPYSPSPLLILAGCVVFGGTMNLQSGGFRLPDQDAFATGRGEAFVATADNASAIYYNPAGITQLDGSNVRLGMYDIFLDPRYRNPNTGQSFDLQEKFHAIPQLFYTYGLTNKNLPLSFGLGIYSPYGLSEKWPQNTGFRPTATEASLDYYTINPVVAYKLPWNISLAAGLLVNYSDIKLQQGLTPVPNNDLFMFKGHSWGVGYNLGLMWQPLKQLSFGTTFRSSTRMDYEGHTDTQYRGLLPTTSSAATLNDYEFPMQVSTGVSYRPTKKWNFEFDAEYTDWNSLGTLTLHQSSPNPVVRASNIPVAFNWESSWYYEFGVTRYFDNGWHVSAGYIFNENSVPNAHYQPVVTDMDKHFFSLGLGYQCRHLSLDVAYQLGYGPDHTVTGSATPAGYPAGYHPADGTYSFLSHAVSVSAGWHF